MFCKYLVWAVIAQAADIVFKPNLDVYYGTQISVKCSIETGMEITLKAPTAASNMRFSLLDPSCLLAKNGNYHTITTKLSGCNNEIYINSTTLTIVNRITNILAVGRQPVRLESRVGCLFHQQEISIGALTRARIPAELAPTAPPVTIPTAPPTTAATKIPSVTEKPSGDKPKWRGEESDDDEENIITTDKPDIPDKASDPVDPVVVDPKGPTGAGEIDPRRGPPGLPPTDQPKENNVEKTDDTKPIKPIEDDDQPKRPSTNDQINPETDPTKPIDVKPEASTDTNVPKGDSPVSPTDSESPKSPGTSDTGPDVPSVSDNPDSETTSDKPVIDPIRPGSPDDQKPPTPRIESPVPDATNDQGTPVPEGPSPGPTDTEVPSISGSPVIPSDTDGPISPDSQDNRIVPDGPIVPGSPDVPSGPKEEVPVGSPDLPSGPTSSPDDPLRADSTKPSVPEFYPDDPFKDINKLNPTDPAGPAPTSGPADPSITDGTIEVISLPGDFVVEQSDTTPDPKSDTTPDPELDTSPAPFPFPGIPVRSGGLGVGTCYGRKCNKGDKEEPWRSIANGQGLFFAKLMLYTDESYENAFTYPPMLRTDDLIFAGVKLMGGPPGTAIAISSCWASNVRHDMMEYPIGLTPYEITLQLISDGCAAEYPPDLVNVVSNGEGPMAKFTSSMFKFVDYDTVHIYCRVRVCPLGPCPQSCNADGTDEFDIQTNVVDLGESSGDDEIDGASMPSFEMLIQSDPYQEGSGPLLGATAYRDQPEELTDELEIIEIEEKETKELPRLLDDSTMIQFILLALLGTACVALTILGAFVIRKRRRQKLPQ